MHQVGLAGDRALGDAERRDQLDVRLGRRRHRDRVPVVDVVDHANGHSARGRVLDRAADDRGGLGPEMKVVLGEVERLFRLAEKGRDLAGDVARLLATVRQRSNFEGLGGQRRLTPANPTIARW